MLTCEKPNRYQHHEHNEGDGDDLPDFSCPPVSPKSCPADLHVQIMVLQLHVWRHKSPDVIDQSLFDHLGYFLRNSDCLAC